MGAERVLANARIVTDQAVVAGALVLRGGRIAEVAESWAGAGDAEDMAGDWLLPGLVELHTDNLERLFSPRPGVRWPADAAMLIHDSQVAAAGITTVCDAVCVGFYGGKSERLDYLNLSIDVLRRARAADALKAEHFLHLRLELTDPHMLELFVPLMADPSLRLVSLMDHTPGQRQWRDLDTYRSFSLGRDVRNEAEFEAMVARRVRDQQEHGQRHRAEVLRLLEGHAAVRASHDDATPAHVDEARACGCTIAEFPTTLGAAEVGARGRDGDRDGGAQPGHRRLALRQRLGGRAGRAGAAGRFLVRLRAGQPAAGGIPSARGLRHPDARRRSHR